MLFNSSLEVTSTRVRSIVTLLLLVLWLVMSVSVARAEAKNNAQIQAKSFGRRNEHGVNYANFKVHKNFYLKLDKVDMKVVMVHELKDCGITCVNNYFCFSFNIAVRPDEYKHSVCEILASDKYNNPSNFTPSEDFHHYSIATPCLNKPCKNGASCIPRYQDDTYSCVCKAGWVGKTCKHFGKFADCEAIKNAGVKMSGIYPIYPDISGPVSVYCDMVTDGGGWTVIQRRIDGSVDFYLDWNSYKGGFGNLSGEFWLGNDNIHRLTASGNTVLRVELKDWSDNTAYAVYDTFMVDDESNKYKLNVGNYSGTAGDALTSNNGMYFTTKDRDNDAKSCCNCAQELKGGWWYISCGYAILNGLYLPSSSENWSSIVWYQMNDNAIPMKKSTMMVRNR